MECCSCSTFCPDAVTAVSWLPSACLSCHPPRRNTATPNSPCHPPRRTRCDSKPSVPRKCCPPSSPPVPVPAPSIRAALCQALPTRRILVLSSGHRVTGLTQEKYPPSQGRRNCVVIVHHRVAPTRTGAV